jgi:hypothetical protein
MLTAYGLQTKKGKRLNARGTEQRKGGIPIVPEIVGKLVFELAVPDACSARAVAEGVARLDHELGDDTVENHVVVVPAARVSDEVLNGLGRMLREQTQVHVPERRVDRRRRREGRCVRGRGRRRGGDRLLFARRTLVEDVSVA